MPFIIFIALSLSKLPSELLLEKATVLSQVFQLKCLSLLPASSARFAQASLLCGKSVTDAAFKEDLVKTSLIHLFVVSGSHLVLLEQMLKLMRLPLFARFLIWIFYSLICGWQPPLVRALISGSLRLVEKTRGSYWPPDLMSLWSGLLTLLLFPSWIQSRSLIMSWGASLALNSETLLTPMNPARRFFWLCVIIYFLMLPMLWGFGNLHPLSILFNLVLAPLVSLWLLPLAFVSVFVPYFQPVLVISCQVFQNLLQRFSEPVEVVNSAAAPVLVLWALIFFLHFSFHCFRLHRRQGQV